jgi:putative transposase
VLPGSQGPQYPERCPKKHVASVRRTLRKAWELDDDAEAERLIRDLAKRMQREAPGVSGSILQGLDEVLTVAGSASRRSCAARSIAPNAIENMQGTIRRVTRT